ncbi:MAG TPA: hypothetical protein VJO52_14060 [Gemmatimonadaceae bacterium]|nr:hypothetical protein [Gemmatimonadaceae bacterium]
MKYLDDEELPFTEEELLHAATKWLGSELAQRLVAETIDALPDYIATRERERKELYLASSGGAVPEGRGTWLIPDKLLAHISVLSTDAAVRIELLMVKRWAGQRRVYVGEELFRHARDAGEWRLPERQRLDSMTLSMKSGGIIHGFPARPIANVALSAVVERAESRVRENIAAWWALVDSVNKEDAK